MVPGVLNRCPTIICAPWYVQLNEPQLISVEARLKLYTYVHKYQDRSPKNHERTPCVGVGTTNYNLKPKNVIATLRSDHEKQ